MRNVFGGSGLNAVAMRIEIGGVLQITISQPLSTGRPAADGEPPRMETDRVMTHKQDE
jgi:hypothetical protein